MIALWKPLILFLPILENTCFRLFPQAKLLDGLTISFYIFPLQIVKEPSSLPDHFDEPLSRVMVFLMNLEVFGKLFDPLAEERYLDLRGARVNSMLLKLFDDCTLSFFCQGQSLCHLLYYSL